MLAATTGENHHQLGTAHAETPPTSSVGGPVAGVTAGGSTPGIPSRFPNSAAERPLRCQRSTRFAHSVALTFLAPAMLPTIAGTRGYVRMQLARRLRRASQARQAHRGGLCVQPRWGLSEDVGRAVAALARGDFPYSSGLVVMVDGGLVIPRL